MKSTDSIMRNKDLSECWEKSRYSGRGKNIRGDKAVTDVIFILDKSGSMRYYTDETIRGFNTMLDVQRKEEGRAYITTVLFNEKSVYLHEREEIEKVKKLTRKDYEAGGCTALLDAVGDAIEKAGRNRCGNKTVVIVITDGLENASVNYTYKEIREKIASRRLQGWEFIFLGANIDVAAEAEKIGIPMRRAAGYCQDDEGVRLNFQAVSKVVSNVRKNEGIGENWKKEIEMYCNAKQKPKEEVQYGESGFIGMSAAIPHVKNGRDLKESKENGDILAEQKKSDPNKEKERRRKISKIKIIKEGRDDVIPLPRVEIRFPEERRRK